jgi:hypothetical protein
MVRGFVIYHTSDESNIEDVFLCLHHPFTNAHQYGSNIINELSKYVDEWNKDEELSEQTGIINWRPVDKIDNESDEEYFSQNINCLADSLRIQEEKNYLVIALFPQIINKYNDFSNWLIKVINAGLSAKVRLMVYDTYDLKAFETLQKENQKHFLYLYPDLDMAGAMNQILEGAKHGKKNEGEKEAVYFQQLLLKLTNAISYTDHQKIEIYQKQCICIAQKHHWPHLEAVVYFFLHSYYSNNNNLELAIHIIEKAIVKSDEAVAIKIIETEDVKYQYRIAKGNLFFMNKRFSDAAEVYKGCLQLQRTTVDKQLLLGIYQMLGASQKHNGEKNAAWISFEEGWSLLDNLDESLLKDNIMIMLYAKDMVATGKEVRAKMDTFYLQMNQWWGEDWMGKINKYHHPPIN